MQELRYAVESIQRITEQAIKSIENLYMQSGSAGSAPTPPQMLYHPPPSQQVIPDALYDNTANLGDSGTPDQPNPIPSQNIKIPNLKKRPPNLDERLMDMLL